MTQQEQRRERGRKRRNRLSDQPNFKMRAHSGLGFKVVLVPAAATSDGVEAWRRSRSAGKCFVLFTRTI